MKLPYSFYQAPTLVVARALLGTLLVHTIEGKRLSGIIVETEAYVTPGDEACHAYRGITKRNSVMFGEPGHAYVYRSYGIHSMLNIVTEPRGIAAAVLIRALEPVEGKEEMQARRMASGRPIGPNLTNGPGRLCEALGIGAALNGESLCEGTLSIEEGRGVDGPIVQTTRIGITRSTELPWRFYLLGNRHVSVRHRAAERLLAESSRRL